MDRTLLPPGDYSDGDGVEALEDVAKLLGAAGAVLGFLPFVVQGDDEGVTEGEEGR